MTVVTSTYLAFKASLVTRLQNDAAIGLGTPRTQVTYGMPRGMPAVDWVLVGGIDGTQRAAALGQQRREESYDVSVLVSIMRSGSDQQYATEQALRIGAAIEANLRNWGLQPTPFDGIVRWAQQTGKYNLSEHFDDQTREGRLDMQIHVDNRI